MTTAPIITLTDLTPHRVRAETLAISIDGQPNGRVVWRDWPGGLTGYRFLPSRSRAPNNHRPARTLLTLLLNQPFGLSMAVACRVVAATNAARLIARRKAAKTGQVAI